MPCVPMFFLNVLNFAETRHLLKAYSKVLWLTMSGHIRRDVFGHSHWIWAKRKFSTKMLGSRDVVPTAG